MKLRHISVLISFLLFSQTAVIASAAPPGALIDTKTQELVETAAVNNPAESAAQPEIQVDVTSIAELRKLAPDGSTTVKVRGYAISWDGGGGLFRYEAGSRPGAYVDNGGTIILPRGGNGSAAWLRIDTGAINVRWFGAKGDGSTDDTTAINKAAALLRTPRKSAEATINDAIVFPPGRYVIAGSVNMTNIRHGRPWHVMAQGAVFLGRGAGKAVFDLCRSRFCVWWGGHIIGDETSTPLMGMQIGRDVPGIVSDDHTFYDLTITGKFSRTCLYNYASEGCYFSHLRLRNSDTSLSSFCLIQDGNGSDFLPRSDFVSIVKKTGPASFNENVFVRPDIRKHNGGPAVYMSRTSGHTWIGAYVVTANDSAFVISSDDFGQRTLNLETHCETGNIQHAVRFTGAARQRIRGFRFIEHSSHALHSIFSAALGVSSVSLEDAEILIAGFHKTPAKGIFSEADKFKVRGSLSINDSPVTGLNIAEFKGRLSIPDRTAVNLPAGSYIVDDNVEGRTLHYKGSLDFDAPGTRP